MRTLAISCLAAGLVPALAEANHPASPQEVANFWDTVFAGAPPYGVPPLAATRTNPRAMGNATVWDVSFDSYRDPDTNLPVRIFGFLAIPSGVTPPGPNRTFPGLVSTHSVGGCPTCNSPLEGLDTALYYADRGFAALSFYLRGYAPSVMADPTLNAGTSNVAFCSNLAGDGEQPLDTLWAGYPVDLVQAAELMAAQPEVWIDNGLSFIGHSLGGYAAVMAGIFSDRYRVIAASAPPTTGSDIPAWFDFGNPLATCAQRLPANAATNRELTIRMVSFIGVHQAIDNALLLPKLDGVEIFFYGGERDTAVPPGNVEESYLLADVSNNKALHWSPTGGHGGPESFYRSDAWLLGHYPGKPPSPPVADLAITAIDGLTVTFSAAGSTDDAIMIAYDYDFGDGETRNWGDNLTHTYPRAGTYRALLTVTDGEGRRDSAMIDVIVGGGARLDIVAGAPDPIVVEEGGSTAFTVRLSAAPGGSLVVALARAGGDPDLSIAPASIMFSDATFDAPQTIAIAAAEDADDQPGTAVFELSAPGVSPVQLDVIESDDDALLAIGVGTATTTPGAEVELPITLVNEAGARLRSFSLTLRHAAALGAPVLARGPAVPGPAWWMFGATSPEAGVQIIAGSELVEMGPIDGVIASARFSISSAIPAGLYPLALESTDIDGAPAGLVTDGFIRIVTATLPPKDPADPGPSPSAADGCGCRASRAPGSSAWIVVLVALSWLRPRRA